MKNLRTLRYNEYMIYEPLDIMKRLLNLYEFNRYEKISKSTRNKKNTKIRTKNNNKRFPKNNKKNKKCNYYILRGYKEAKSSK